MDSYPFLIDIVAWVRVGHKQPDSRVSSYIDLSKGTKLEENVLKYSIGNPSGPGVPPLSVELFTAWISLVARG